MKTTLNQIRKHSPCEAGWKKLLAHLGKTKADHEPLSIKTVLESNGLDDALWCLRAVDGHDREIRLFAVWCARQVQHLMTDQRSLDALDVAERFANGQATEEELKSAEAAAWDASRDVARAAWDAVRAARAARAAAMAARAAWAAARAAAWAAAWEDEAMAAEDAAWTAAWAAARAAEDAAEDAQKAELIRICNVIEKGGVV